LVLTPLEFVDRILLLKEIVPFSVSSWGRTQDHNTLVGGVPRSAHKRWLGIDVIPDAPSPETLAILQTEADRLDLEVIDEWAAKQHYHVQPKGWINLAW
jgi:hypothetical protein